MFGTAAISFVGAASQLVIMVVLGIPLALPVFVLSFFLCFIPYIGGFISTGIAFLLTVALGSATDVVIMGIWTIVFNIVTGNIVAPAGVRADRPPPPGDRAGRHPGRVGDRRHPGHVHRRAGAGGRLRDLADRARRDGLARCAAPAGTGCARRTAADRRRAETEAGPPDVLPADVDDPPLAPDASPA